MVGQEDIKLTVKEFNGLYSRGIDDDVPTDHAQDCQNWDFATNRHISTRDGSTTGLNTTWPVRRFFLTESIPPNYLEPYGSDPDGYGLITLDNSGNLYNSNSATPIYTQSLMSDFAACNVANKTLISPNSGLQGFQKGRVQIFDSLLNTIRDAAGLAPAQNSGSSLSAATGSTGNVSVGIHQFAVLFETSSGFLTQPGPKIYGTCSASPSITQNAPTVITLSNHGLNTGESHTLTGGASQWAVLNDTWFVTVIDQNTFSIPVDTFGFSGTGSFTIAGAFTAASVTGDGTRAINITNIPTGPTGTVARWIIGTIANQTEFFFIPNVVGSQSIINDNTTTLCTVNFFDTDLTESADYLFDILEVIPGGTQICKYRGRIILCGCMIPGVSNGEQVLISNSGDPETIDTVTGILTVQTENDGNFVSNVWVLRDVLYLCKFTGVFSTEDNGGDPYTWAISVIDGVVGCYAYGASVFTASQSVPDTGDIVLIAHRTGLFLFDGVMRRPELSQKIQSLWKSINFAAFARVTVAHDPWNHRIYIAAPIGTATQPNVLLMMDYTDGRDPTIVRWTKWVFPRTIDGALGMMFFGTSYYTKIYTLFMGNLSNTGLVALTPGLDTDNGSAIDSFYIPGPFTAKEGYLSCFKHLSFRAIGSGTLNLLVTGQDGFLEGSPIVSPPTPITLSTNPQKDLSRQINIMNEKLNLKIDNGINPGDNITLARIDVWSNPLYAVRINA